MKNLKNLFLGYLLLVISFGYSQQPHSGGIVVPTGFKITANQPVDDRTVVTSVEDLDTLPNKYAGLICYVEDSESVYYYNGTEWNIIGSDTGGYFKEITKDGGFTAEKIEGGADDGKYTFKITGDETLEWTIGDTDYVYNLDSNDEWTFIADALGTGIERRIDAVSYGNDGQIHYWKGTETGQASYPNVPENHILKTFVTLTEDGSIIPSSPDLSGYVLKNHFKWGSTVYSAGSGNDVYLLAGSIVGYHNKVVGITNLYPDPELRILGCNINTTLTNKPLWDGVTIRIKFSLVAGKTIRLKNNISGANVPTQAKFLFPDGLDYLPDNNEILTFVLRDTGFLGWKLEFTGSNMSSGGPLSADQVSYDNTVSGLDATNVQDAIDEISENTSNITLEQARQNGNVLEGDIVIENISSGQNETGFISEGGFSKIVFTDEDGIKIDYSQDNVNSQVYVFSNSVSMGVKSDVLNSSIDVAATYIGSEPSIIINASSNTTTKGLIANIEFDKQGDRKAFAQISDLEDSLEDYVELTGDQTVADVKTFTSSPIVPTATTPTQAVNFGQMTLQGVLDNNNVADGVGIMLTDGSELGQYTVDGFHANSGSTGISASVSGKGFLYSSANGRIHLGDRDGVVGLNFEDNTYKNRIIPPTSLTGNFSHTLQNKSGVLAHLDDIGDVADGSVTNAKLANMAANTIKVRNAATAGSPNDLAISSNRLVGRGSTGNISEITVGGGLSFSGSQLVSDVYRDHYRTITEETLDVWTDDRRIYKITFEGTSTGVLGIDISSLGFGLGNSEAIYIEGMYIDDAKDRQVPCNYRRLIDIGSSLDEEITTCYIDNSSARLNLSWHDVIGGTVRPIEFSYKVTIKYILPQ